MKIIGITACPTGIAHTYMAQECLEKECRKRGFDVKIETQGGLGIENELSEGEERFENKRVLHTDVDEAISHVEKLVDRAVALVEGN